MFYKVYLHQSFLYEETIEAGSAAEAEALAREHSKTNEMNWLPDGRLKTFTVKEIPAPLTPPTVSDGVKEDNATRKDQVLSYVFGKGAEDDPFRIVNATE